MNRRWIGALTVIAIAAVLAIVFRGPLSDLSRGQITQTIYLVLWLVLIAGGAATSRSRLGPHWLRNAALWLAIILALAGGAYVFKDQLTAFFGAPPY